jgi:hypothetical protein
VRLLGVLLGTCCWVRQLVAMRSHCTESGSDFCGCGAFHVGRWRLVSIAKCKCIITAICIAGQRLFQSSYKLPGDDTSDLEESNGSKFA